MTYAAQPLKCDCVKCACLWLLLLLLSLLLVLLLLCGVHCLLQKVEDSEQDFVRCTVTPPSPVIIGSLKPVVQLKRLDLQRSL